MNYMRVGMLLAILGGGKLSLLCIQKRHTEEDDIPLELPEGNVVVLKNEEKDLDDDELDISDKQLEIFEQLLNNNERLKGELQNKSDHSSDWEDIDSDDDFFDDDDDDDDAEADSDADHSDATEAIKQLMNDPEFISELIRDQHLENARLHRKLQK